jgi:hypothetical protein
MSQRTRILHTSIALTAVGILLGACGDNNSCTASRADPCHAQYVAPVGRTVQDLVQAIRKQPIYRVSRPEPVTIGGAKGTHLQIGIPLR